MNRMTLLRLWVMMFSSVLVLRASANGFALPDQDAFATARGEAFVATADNPSAIFYNPAGITQLEGNNLRGGAYGIYLDQSFRPPVGAPNYGQTYYNRDNYALVPRFFYTYTLPDSPLSFGLGLYSPYGGKSSWPQNTGFRSVGTGASLTYITINPVVALKAAPGLSLAGGLMVNYAKIELDQGLSVFPTPLTNYFRFSGSGWSVGYNLGLLWQPHPKISLGATFRSSAMMNFQGDARYEQLPFILSASHSARMDLEFPTTATVGASYRPTPKWNMEFDASYTDWGSFGTTAIRQSSTTYPVLQDIPLNLDWQPSWMYELGVTRYFDSGWHASAGAVYSENSVPDAYYNPLVADLDRYFLSTGVGFKGKRLSFDIAYQLGYGPSHTVAGSQPSSVPSSSTGQTADGKYEFFSHAISLSAGWSF